METFELDTKSAQEKLDLGLDMLELPRAHRMKTADLGIDEASYQSVAGGYAAGDDRNADICETALQVFLEMMSRTPNDGPRLLHDPYGKPTLGDNGGKMAKKCSRWAVAHEDCEAANVSKFNPKPKAGHWKTFVETNWRQIMPRLVFASDNAAPGASASMDREFNIETWKRTRDASLSDKSADRMTLKSWLIPFLKDPICKWDGTK